MLVMYGYVNIWFVDHALGFWNCFHGQFVIIFAGINLHNCQLKFGRKQSSKPLLVDD